MSTLKVEFEKDLPNATRTNLLAFGIALLFLYLRTFRVPIVPFAVNGDEILFFSRALRILHGQVIYRDFFELVTPGTELLYALGFRLFGVRGWVMEAWHIVLGTSLCLVITSIARRILRGAAVFCRCCFFWPSISVALWMSRITGGAHWPHCRLLLCSCQDRNHGASSSQGDFAA